MRALRSQSLNATEGSSQTHIGEWIATPAQTTVTGAGWTTRGDVRVGLAPAFDMLGKSACDGWSLSGHVMSAGDWQVDESHSKRDQQEEGGQRWTKGRPWRTRRRERKLLSQHVINNAASYMTRDGPGVVG
jgi:hypothetical protein